MNIYDRITLVVTSSGRLDLLDQTLKSFWNLCPHKFAKTIIHDDSGDDDVYVQILNMCYGKFDHILCPPNKRGYSAALDACFDMVETEYVFTTENDWSYYKNHGFIEKSFKILEEHSDIHQVWIRDHDCTRHPMSRRPYTLSGIQVKEVMKGYQGVWNGFSLNPGLRRMSDLKRFFPNGLSEYGDEIDCARRTEEIGYNAVALMDTSIRHIGWHRRTPNFKN
jgi:hypothetical protein